MKNSVAYGIIRIMSPECFWSGLPRSIKNDIKSRLGKPELARLLNGEGFAITKDGEIVEDNCLTPKQLGIIINRARREPEFYHIISLKSAKHAENARKTRDEAYPEVSNDEAPKKDGWGGKQHRGK